ncbi:MAG: DUF4351 domain-containing protein, partial [Magnetococcales bacterium]|nr:DUF4351 domain-containing protein [Magnetococcales bacterium]
TVPEQIRLIPIRHAFEKAMVANMTPDELELYDKAGIAITDARGAVELAREEGEAKGRQEGIRIGERKGLREGEMRALLRQIQRRFGIIPQWVHVKLTNADLQTLETWTERILDVESLEDVFQ